MKNLLPLLLLLSCSAEQPQTPATEEHQHAEASVTLTDAQFNTSQITVATVAQKQLSGAIKVNGFLDVPPQQLVSISFPFAGTLKETELLQGMWINKGQTIATLESPDFIQMQQDYLDLKSQLAYQEQEVKRQETLAQEQVNAQKVLQKAVAELESLKARLAGLKQRLALIRINADALSIEKISSTVNIPAPISGYVTQVNVNIGQHVQPNDVLFQIVDTRHLHAELQIFEQDIPKLAIGQKVRFQLANESKEREAKVYLIGREIGPDRSIRVHCHLEGEDKALLPKAYLQAMIEVGTHAVSALPEEAIVRDGARLIVFVYEGKEGEEHHFKPIEVKTGVTEMGFTEVILPEGMAQARIATKGTFDIFSKMRNSEEEGHGH